MKKYIVMETWGNLFSDDLEFEAKNRKDVINQYLKKKGFENVKVVYDSLKNHIQDSSRVICIQEGHFDGDIKWIRGKRGFYKILDNITIHSSIENSTIHDIIQ